MSDAPSTNPVYWREGDPLSGVMKTYWLQEHTYCVECRKEFGVGDGVVWKIVFKGEGGWLQMALAHSSCVISTKHQHVEHMRF